MTRIAVIGEQFTDKYWLGSTNRLSAEAPIPVVHIDGLLFCHGGAANVAANVRSLGAEPIEVFQPDAYAPTKNRLMVGEHQLARWDENDSAHAYDGRRFPIGGVDGIIISDYGKGMFTSEAIHILATQVGNVPVFIDTKQNPHKFTPVASINSFWFPNLAEYRQYREAYEDLDNVVLKRGAEGLQCGSLKIPATAERVVSVNGAGDTVIAAFAVQYLTYPNIEDALIFASLAAAKAVESPYTTAVRRELIDGPITVR